MIHRFNSDVQCYLQQEKFDTVRFELHQLLAQPSLVGVPLLVVSLLPRRNL